MSDAPHAPPKKAISPIVQYRHEGRDAPPSELLRDAYDCPVPNCDQRLTDIHGREVQPDHDPTMRYQPNEAPLDAPEEAAHKAAMRQGRRFFTQAQVDEVRLRIMMHLATRYTAHPPQHVWFEVPGDIDAYELRPGNAPPPADRPRHLRRLNLVIDVALLGGVAKMLAPGGAVMRTLEEQSANLDIPASPDQLLGHVIRQLARELAHDPQAFEQARDAQVLPVRAEPSRLVGP